MRHAFVALLLSTAVDVCSAAELSLTLSGTEFKGMPAFEARLGDDVVATGMLTSISPEGEEFTFTVDGDYAFAPLGIRLTNDRYEKGVGDRNLYIIAVRFAGVDLPLADFIYRQGEDILDRNSARLYTNSVVAVANPPEAGWPLEVNTQEASEARTSTDGSSDPVAVTAAPDDRECVQSRVDIVGFENGAIDLSREQLAQLEALALSECAVTVTGYSSTSGSSGANQRIAQERANAVAAALGVLSPTGLQVHVTAMGETSDFGASQAANRRVVIEMKPADS